MLFTKPPANVNYVWCYK